MKHTLTLLAALLLAPLAAPNAADTPPANLGVAGNLAFETSSFMKETEHVGRKGPPKDWHTRSGAMSVNATWEADKSLPWFVEEQRIGRDHVTAGLASSNKDQTRWGLKILAWGFAQMSPDGEFKHRDNYHSSAFIVEATAHALLLLEASPWRAEFADETKPLQSKLLTTARWMTRPDVHDLAWPDRSKFPKARGEWPYGHRRYLDAAALGETGVLCHDKELIEKSTTFIHEGIAFQRPDGVNTENGGHDTLYQATGLLYACRYYQIVADDVIRAEMKPMLEKGFAWLISRIQPDGSVDATGNTRTGFGQEKGRSGKPKGLNYRLPAVSLAHWAQLTQNAELEATARRVYEADRKLRAR